MLLPRWLHAFQLSLLFLHVFQVVPVSALAQDTAVAKVDARCLELYEQRSFQEATKCFRKAVEENKSDAQAWYYLGLSLKQQPSELKPATNAFKTALGLQPDFTAARVELGYVFLLRNNTLDAISEALTALQLDPKIPDAHYILGRARFRSGAKTEALRYADTAIKLDPQFPLAYLLKSEILLSVFVDNPLLAQKEPPEVGNARYREAAEALEKYLQLDPNTEDKEVWTEQLKSLHFHIALKREGDTPERVYSGKEVTMKARTLDMPPPGMTEAARTNRVNGTVILRGIVASDGTLKHILIMKGLPSGLTEETVKAARLTKYSPATIDGRPVPTFMQLEYNFNLY